MRRSSSTECGGKLDALEGVGGVVVQQAEVTIYLSDEERHILRRHPIV